MGLLRLTLRRLHGGGASGATARNVRIRRPPRTAPASAFALCAALLTAAGTAAVMILLGVAGPPPVNGYVPWDLTNFQNEYACDNTSVRIVRPRTMEDVKAAVRLHSSIMAVGGGWSWNQPFFCASNGTNAPTPDGYRWVNGSGTSGSRGPPTPNGPANIVMQTLRPLLIQVNETEETVTVDAGVRTIDLLRYLAAYVTPSAPSGWTLPAFPWFVFQTLGGAVSTNTHGSSLKHSSLSSQVLALTMVLANGTVRTFTNETDPFLMRAVRVGIGKLGIITHIKFRIIREMPVTRTIHRISSTEFLAQLRVAQEQWNDNGTLPDWMDGTEWFWVPQRHEFLMVTFTRGDAPDAAKRLAVLSAYATQGPEITTAYNTSLEVLEQAADLRNGNITVDVWPLLSNVTFDPTTNISNVALPVLRRLNDTVINVPWPQSPGAGAGAGGGAAAAAAAAASTSPTVSAMQGPTPSSSLASLAATVAASRNGAKKQPATSLAGPPVTDSAAAAPAEGSASNITTSQTVRNETEVAAKDAVTTMPTEANELASPVMASAAAPTATPPAPAAKVAPASSKPPVTETPAPGTKDASVTFPSQVVSLFRAHGDGSKVIGPIGTRRVTNNTSSNAAADVEVVAEGSDWKIPDHRPATVFYGLSNMADAYIDISRSGVYSIAANATKEAQSSYLFQPESILEVNIRKVMYDQYEAAIPVSSMADCWQGLLELLYGADNLDGTAYNGTASPLSIVSKLAKDANGTSLTGSGGRPDYGFRSNPLIRLTGAEDGLLSPSGGQPHIWLNIEDYLYYNRPLRRSNVVFKALVGYLRSDPRCGGAGLTGSGARMHWGKAGWPDVGCWHGDKEYPDTWCDFGCAVRQLDPDGKFRDSAPDRWNWEGAPLERCCVPDRGFKTADDDPACVCKVAHKRGAETCPPSPYYTYR